MKKVKESPFFCYRKMCRKTAWDTPEYMSKEDWDFLQQVYDILLKKDVGAFIALQSDPIKWKALFNRMLGWPEGDGYCLKYDYVVKAFMPGVGKHMLPDIKMALGRHWLTNKELK